MLDQCAFCGYGIYVPDGIPLCHSCYGVFADPVSPFYAPYLLKLDRWKEMLSDPNAMMWVEQRIKENQ